MFLLGVRSQEASIDGTYRITVRIGEFPHL